MRVCTAARITTGDRSSRCRPRSRMPATSCRSPERCKVGSTFHPVLDFEENGGLAPGNVAQWARNWLQEVERLTGRTPIIYTGYYFWRDSVGGPTDFGRYPLWVASWTNAAAPALIPSSWSTWTFWQWTSTGSSAGNPVDHRPQPILLPGREPRVPRRRQQPRVQQSVRFRRRRHPAPESHRRVGLDHRPGHDGVDTRARVRGRCDRRVHLGRQFTA